MCGFIRYTYKCVHIRERALNDDFKEQRFWCDYWRVNAPRKEIEATNMKDKWVVKESNHITTMCPECLNTVPSKFPASDGLEGAGILDAGQHCPFSRWLQVQGNISPGPSSLQIRKHVRDEKHGLGLLAPWSRYFWKAEAASG